MPARQQTLRQTIDWSHDLLSAAEQKLLRRLSVFAGGFTLESAEAVSNTQRDLEIDLLEGMASLVDKSLVQQVERKDGEARFTMLETIREYGLERLAASGEVEATQQAHAAYFLVLAEESKLPLTRPEWTNWLALCDAEHDNLRAALDWLIASDNSEWALRLGLALNWFWELREHFVEGRKRLEAILRMKGAQARSKAWAKAAGHAGGLASVQGDYEGALRLHREALDIYCELGDQIGIVKQLSSGGLKNIFMEIMRLHGLGLSNACGRAENWATGQKLLAPSAIWLRSSMLRAMMRRRAHCSKRLCRFPANSGIGLAWPGLSTTWAT